MPLSENTRSPRWWTVTGYLLDDDERHQRMIRIGPLHYWSFWLKGEYAPPRARALCIGRWALMCGPGDGLTEGLSAKARVWWLRTRMPNVLLSHESKEAFANGLR